MTVSLLAHTPDAERVVAAAAKNCYSAVGGKALLERMDDAEVESFLVKFLSLGHESLLEHAVFTFSVDGVSRSLLAQITRHRIASFSVKSQRYVSEKNFESVTPPSVCESAEASDIFAGAVAASGKAYRELIALGIPKEDARFVLPNACATNIVFTMNARELLHFFRLRCCNRAQWEIRALADEMLSLVRSAAPKLFTRAGPGCVWETCPEGTMSCGKAAAIRNKYRGEPNNV